MKKAVIIYHGKNDKTKKYGEEITKFLLDRGVAAELVSIASFDPERLEGVDYVLLGSPISDSFFLLHQPDEEWVEFAKNFPVLDGVKVALFATYKIIGGNILRKMKKHLNNKIENVDFVFKSRDGSLTVPDKMLLNDFIR